MLNHQNKRLLNFTLSIMALTGCFTATKDLLKVLCKLLIQFVVFWVVLLVFISGGDPFVFESVFLALDDVYRGGLMWVISSMATKYFEL